MLVFNRFLPGRSLPILLLAVCGIAWPALAQNTPPPQMAFFSSVVPVQDNWVFTHIAWDELDFPSMNGVAHPMKRGEYWRMYVDLEQPHVGPDSWNFLKPSFLKNGWTVVQEAKPDVATGVLHYTQKGKDSWLRVDITGQRVEMLMIDVIPVPATLTLKLPAATPETFDPARDDFPYLAPIPGAASKSGKTDPDPFWISPKEGPAEMVAPGSLMRAYRYSNGMSNVMFLTVYKPALIQAGWDILNESSGGDAVLLARYTKNGRDIWAYLHNDGDGTTIQVADLGATDLGAGLKKSCHVALYGVLFDFNKATLQPASDPVLQKVADLLAKDPALKVEVQGHTDNVGADAYNQTLSEARARAVMDWLVKHGVAPGRLTAKGYGKTRPVADNGSDDGRAKNRRVEIANPSCTETQSK
jgi:outer membrane protein OmpA-like peptidoglycan-associated protein